MKRSGVADLPLHGERVPQWLAERMTTLGCSKSDARQLLAFAQLSFSVTVRLSICPVPSALDPDPAS